MEEIKFIEPVSCTDCRAAFLRLKKNRTARLKLVAERQSRAPCRGCASLLVYERGGVL